MQCDVAITERMLKYNVVAKFSNAPSAASIKAKNAPPQRKLLLSDLVPAQHQRLDRQQQRLNPQQQRMHKSGRIDDMQREALERTEFA